MADLNLLMTGASGFLGSHLYGYLCSPTAQGLLATWEGGRGGDLLTLPSPQFAWQIHGTYHRQRPPWSGGHLHGVDLTDGAAVADFWRRLQPQAVIHSAAISNAHQCEQDPVGSGRLNVTAAVALAQRAAEAGIPFVFLSTGLVFGGDRAPYGETVAPHPLSYYGRQKAEAEAAILAAHPQALICRLPLLYGAATATAQCFLQGFLHQLRQGQAISLFTDEFRTPVAAGDAARGIVQMLVQGVTGILHLGGPERISRYGFGRIMARHFGVPMAAMVPTRRAEVSLPVPRPGDTALDSRRAFALGYRPRSVETVLAAIAGASQSGGCDPATPTA
ncbi:MAG: SDR family oxidoreductase [Cyanobacteria bacterium]|nr:SDR family oxidoreductase [Cyanobacteriota bacterium]